MNGQETITAAIEKLEGLRDAATEAPWTFYGGEPFGYGVACSTGLVIYRDEVTDEDADLVVTLHRTIDAQLAILRLSIEYGNLPNGSGSRFTAAALDLARVILGDDNSE